MKLSVSLWRIEKRAPSSSVSRERARIAGEVEGVGRRAFSFRRAILARDRSGVGSWVAFWE